MMDKEIRDRLRECLREFTASGDIDASLAGQARAKEIRPYLAVAAALQEDARGLPLGSPHPSGRAQLLSALRSTTRPSGARMGILQLGFARAGAAAVVGLFVVGGVAGGVSPAVGGPNLAGPVVHAVTGTNDADDQADAGQHANPNASEGAANAGQSGNASDTGQQHANPNAGEGAANAGQGSDNASDAGQQHANPNAGEGAANAGQSDNASDTGQQHANPNSTEGADNAGQGSDNASDTGQQHANPNAGEGADNAGQGSDNASDAGQQHANRNAGEGADNAGQGGSNGRGLDVSEALGS